MTVETQRLLGEALCRALPDCFIELAQTQIHVGGKRCRIAHRHLVMLNRIALELLPRGFAAVNQLDIRMLIQPMLGNNLADFAVERCLVHGRTSIFSF